MQETVSLGVGQPRRAGSRVSLLVIDPDAAVRNALAGALQQWQVDVVITDNAADGLVLAGRVMPHAVLTAADSGLMTGSEIVRVLHRSLGIATIVGVGERDGPEASLALAAGATACVARPYRVTEILTMLRAIAPEHAGDLLGVLQVGGLRLDPNAHEVLLHGRPVAFPMREFNLLQLLMTNTGRVVTRGEISRLIWGGNERSNTVNVHIRRIRARLGDATDNKIIVSVRGMGYRLDPP